MKDPFGAPAEVFMEFELRKGALEGAAEVVEIQKIFVRYEKGK